jgi:predicted ester cyclase
MSVEENKILVTRFYEQILNGRRMDVAKEILSPQYVDHSAFAPGLENFERYFAMITSVFPDIKVIVEDVLIDADKAAVRLTIQGTQLGHFRGFPPTGQKVTWTGMDIIHISNHKITERWSERDFLQMLLQLGHVQYPSKPI